MTNLFQSGKFALASGEVSEFKIVCDSLTPADWKTLALMILPSLPKFGTVEGVPSGGLAFARALQDFATEGHARTLICDDVLTTGGSMGRHRAGRVNTAGVVAFCRGNCPRWVVPVFRFYQATGR